MQKIFSYQVYTNLVYVLPIYRRVKKLKGLIINKNIRKEAINIPIKIKNTRYKRARDAF